MTPSVPPLDWTADLFQPDGSVDWPAARNWITNAHVALQQAHGERWTDAHAAWLGRLAHDALRYQGEGLTEATEDSLSDLLFSLQVAQRTTVPAPVEACIPALRQLFEFGATHLGQLGARAALGVLDNTVEHAFVEAMAAPPDPTPEPEDPPKAPQSRAERRAAGFSRGPQTRVRRKKKVR